jgi:hypothetical protein
LQGKREDVCIKITAQTLYLTDNCNSYLKHFLVTPHYAQTKLGLTIMRKIIPLSIASLTLIGVFIFLHNKYSNTFLSTQIDTSINEESIEESAGGAKSSSMNQVQANEDAQPTRKLADQLTPDDIDNRFPDVDSDTNLVEYVTQLLKDADNDRTGASHIRIAKAMIICDNTPKNNTELQQQIKNYETFASENGRDNGQIQDALAKFDQEYKSCLEIKKIVSNKTAYDFYKDGSELGHPVAKVALVDTAPPNWDSYSKEERNAHQLQMGRILSDARAKCEPTAFLAFAEGDGRLPQYKYWSDPEDMSSEIRQYANFIAYSLFYANRISGGEEIVSRYNSLLDQWSMPTYELEKAKAYGLSLYKKHCENKYNSATSFRFISYWTRLEFVNH